MKQKVTKARKARTRWTKFNRSPLHHLPVWVRRQSLHHFGPDHNEYDQAHGLIGSEGYNPFPYGLQE